MGLDCLDKVVVSKKIQHDDVSQTGELTMLNIRLGRLLSV